MVLEESSVGILFRERSCEWHEVIVQLLARAETTLFLPDLIEDRHELVNLKTRPLDTTVVRTVRTGLLEAVEDAHAGILPRSDMQTAFAVHIIVGDDFAAERAVEKIFERISIRVVGPRNLHVKLELVQDIARVHVD